MAQSLGSACGVDAHVSMVTCQGKPQARPSLETIATIKYPRTSRKRQPVGAHAKSTGCLATFQNRQYQRKRPSLHLTGTNTQPRVSNPLDYHATLSRPSLERHCPPHRFELIWSIDSPLGTACNYSGHTRMFLCAQAHCLIRTFATTTMVFLYNVTFSVADAPVQM